MDSVALIARLLLSLGVVLGVMWLLARRLRGRGRVANNEVIDVLARQQLSRTSSVAVVQVMDQALILGVTDTTVSVIGETDLAAARAKLDEQARTRSTMRALPSAATLRLSRDRLRDRSGGKPGALTGSVLSPTTWRGVLDALRDLTARRR